MRPAPFTIRVDDAVLDDLQHRLGRVRWPDAEPVDDWSQGVPLAYLQDLVASWRDDYDWRERERRLNRHDQFLVPVDAGTTDHSMPLNIHVLHRRSRHDDATPLLITHGWPGSIVELDAVVDALVDPTSHGGTPDDAFHVIAPSLPGFGFSDAPHRPGVGVERIADIWHDLMTVLGYDAYVAQGGDWGSAVTARLGATGRCAAIHVTLALHAPPHGEPGNPEERRAVERLSHYLASDSGYSAQQSTRPQTLGYALADSPVGQLAWIVEKFWAWTDRRDTRDQIPIDRDIMLDNVMLYWVTNTATSSARLYWESFRSIDIPPVEVPTGVSVFPYEIVPPVRSWLDDSFRNIRYWNAPERGGHFAALEVPDLFVNELRSWKRAVS